MRLPKRGEKGFTLIELLIVVAILGVLAAVVIPNVTQFFGRGKTEAARTELHNIQTAVTAMMVDNSITDMPKAVIFVELGTAYNDMALTAGIGFPDFTSTPAEKGFTGTTPVPSVGYLLYGHDKIDPDDTTTFKTVNYLTMRQSTYFYTCETDGTVRQFSSAVASAATEIVY